MEIYKYVIYLSIVRVCINKTKEIVFLALHVPLRVFPDTPIWWKQLVNVRKFVLILKKKKEENKKVFIGSTYTIFQKEI